MTDDELIKLCQPFTEAEIDEILVGVRQEMLDVNGTVLLNDLKPLIEAMVHDHPESVGASIDRNVCESAACAMYVATALRVLRKIAPDLVVWPPEPVDPFGFPVMTPGPKRVQ